ncbi:hypothetical protein, conserved [Angomonas deanei]|uniref:Uncharacterized protein n=1 Tax=Angomonas deanei TaxID=59799 RepID=A0A7G2C641_9TRYP|nr:hypothetical protein, conserved [Angomonas deanei]
MWRFRSSQVRAVGTQVARLSCTLVHRSMIPPTERLTQPPGVTDLRDTYVDNTNERRENEKGFGYPVKRENIGLFDRGVSPEAKDFIATAEAEYKASSDYLHQVPNGMPETTTYIDEETGLLTERTTITAPVGETYIPSSKERYALRGNGEELQYQREKVKRYLLDEQAQLNLKKERQLDELLTSPMKALEKANEVALLLEQFYTQKLSLQRKTAENVMLLFSQVSLQQRMAAAAQRSPQLEAHDQKDTPPLLQASCASIHDVPFLKEMRRLYQHLKVCFVAPTPLVIEHLMSTLAVVTNPDKNVFHLANRLYLDCDRFVVLPTRSTYAAFFDICRVNDAMKVAVARWVDATAHLYISTDADMLTTLLKGLNERGYVQEAVALLGNVKEVPVTTPLLNASLETLLLSTDPLACYSLYEGVVKDGSVVPDAETYTLLLLACEKSGLWENTKLVLADMQRRRIKGSSQTLNLLLKGLLTQNLNSYAVQLYRTMRKKKVPVWSSLDSALRKMIA